MLWQKIIAGCSSSCFWCAVCDAQECVLLSLVIRREVRWENSHYHWSQHRHRQGNSQRSGQKRWHLVSAGNGSCSFNGTLLNATVVFKLQSLSIMCGLCPQYPLSRKKDRNKNTHVLVSKKHRWDDLWIQYHVYFPTPDTEDMSPICILQLIRGKDKRLWWQTRHRRDRGSIVKS